MSVAAIPAQGSTLRIAGSASSAVTITAITVGYPTILAITGHTGVANGDVVTFAGFAGADAALLNGLTATAKNYATGATNDTIAVDINTVGKTITCSGATITPSAWVKVGNISTIKASGSTAPKYDVSDLDSTRVEKALGLPDCGTVTMDNFCVDSDAGQTACLYAFLARTVQTFKITYPSGGTPNRTFAAFVAKFQEVGDAAINKSVTGTVELEITGTVTKS